MKVVLLDETRVRCAAVVEQLSKKKITVQTCSGSGDFVEACENGAVDAICLDMESWHKGRALYKYFDVTRRISSIPMIFYNAPEAFTNLPGREKNEKDRILHKPSEPEAVADAVCAL